MCTIDQKLMENFLCYIIGIFNIGFIILILGMIYFICYVIKWYITELNDNGINEHCNHTIICSNDPYNIKMKVCGLYLIIPILGVIFLFLLPYYLTVPMFGKFNPIFYCVTAMLGIFLALMLALMVGTTIHECIVYNNDLTSYRENSDKSDIPIYGTISTPNINMYQTV
jgi:hypothetical protein